MTQTYKVQVSMNQAHIVESGFVWKQGDFGFNIEIEVLDFDTTGATPQIIFRKSSGAVEATQISVAGNKFTYAIRGTELDTPGPCVCDLKLKDSTTKRVSTASFKYFVIPDTMDGLEQEASSYSDTIEQVIDNAAAMLNNNFAPEYSTTSTYKIGDQVIYNKVLYKCVVQIATAENWTAAHWQEVKAGNEITGIANAVNNTPLRSLSLTVLGGTIHSSAKDLIYAGIKTGQKYKIKIVSSSAQRKPVVYLYAADMSAIAYYNTAFEYDLTAEADIAYIGLYYDARSNQDSTTFITSIMYNPIGYDLYETMQKTDKTLEILTQDTVIYNQIIIPAGSVQSYLKYTIPANIKNGSNIYVELYNANNTIKNNLFIRFYGTDGVNVTKNGASSYDFVANNNFKEIGFYFDARSYENDIIIGFIIGFDPSGYNLVKNALKAPFNSDVILYFANGNNPVLSFNADQSKSTLDLSNVTGLTIRQISQSASFTTSDILTAAAAYDGVTVDTNAKTISGTAFVWIYNIYTKGIVFRASSSNLTYGDILIYYQHYRSAFAGKLLDIVQNKELFIPDKSVLIDDAAFKTVDAYYAGTNESDTFIFFSDPHTMSNNSNFTLTYRSKVLKDIETIKQYASIINPSVIICGGDVLNSGDTQVVAAYKLRTYMSLYDQELKGFRFVLGNHDTNYQGKIDTESAANTGQFDQDILDNMLFANTDTKKAYYSFETDMTKYYCLDTGIDWDATSMTDYRWAQIDWLGERLEEEQSEHIIIVMHMFSKATSAETYGTDDLPMSVNLISLITAYNNRTSVTLNSQTYDFTNATGYIHCILTGHTHYDKIYIASDDLPVVCITDATDYAASPIKFDIGFLDYENKKLYLTRVNDGENRSVDLR